ncbi:PREDICTED: uncharacterized protein LOC109341779 [Lupinus angustifolius]|uniref:uncharacterized protein LOC109341779 n=1 Tax=Lupinus angustifolius TaxID=3871 RepID=UPI00092E9A44|nr:PREDICTED: uncharacterized protein LOC109341779 [Lupinus angustifolius]
MNVCVVYAHTNHVNRRSLWLDIQVDLLENQGPWCCIGDFNAILGVDECRSATLPSRTSTSEFLAFTNSSSLIKVPTLGAQFTWTNKRRGNALIEKKLDRSLCNEDWLNLWSQVSCCTLPRIASDHHPILLSSTSTTAPIICSFKFQKMWLQNTDCKRLIKDSGQSELIGCPMFILSQKLKRLKKELKHWNYNVFGNIHHMVKMATTNLNYIQKNINDMGVDEALLDHEAIAQSELLRALSVEEVFWKEKARINWHIDGDRNTSFFHKTTSIRQKTKTLSMLRVGDTTITEQQDIADHVLQYYTNLFDSPNLAFPNELFRKVIPVLVSKEDNNHLTQMPSSEEIKRVVFAMSSDSSPGPDGFGGSFYHHCWDIVSIDVCNSVKQFFSKAGCFLTSMQIRLY